MIIEFLGRDYSVVSINFLQCEVCVIYKADEGLKMVQLTFETLKEKVKLK